MPFRTEPVFERDGADVGEAIVEVAVGEVVAAFGRGQQRVDPDLTCVILLERGQLQLRMQRSRVVPVNRIEIPA